MKSLGFLLAMAMAMALTSAQSQNYAGAQANSAAWAGAAPKGARVISVPPGSIIYKPGPGSRPPQNKVAQAAAGARSVARSGPTAAQANAHAASHAQVRPHHPGHSVPHVVKQVPKTAVATASAQAVAVSKPAQQSPSDKNSSQVFQLPDFSALALPKLLSDLPADFLKVIQAALTDSPLAKAASDLVAAYLAAQSATVPVIIGSVRNGLLDASNLISPENVEKALAKLAGKSQEALTAIAVKLAELAVSQADKIGSLIKNLIQAGQVVQAIAIGLSVVTTLYLIFQNEVLPKLNIDLSQLPIPLDKLPISLDQLQRIQWDQLDKLNFSLPISLDKLPIPLDTLPVHLDKLSIHLHKLPIPLDKLPIPLDRWPITIEKWLELCGLKPSPPANGQVVAKASSEAKAVAVGDGVAATAVAQSAAAAEEYSGESGEHDEVAASASAVAG